MEALLREDILFGIVNSPDDLLDDPHLAATDMFPVVEHPTEGPIRLLGFPVTFSETPCQLRHLPPNLGEHDETILAELGFTPDEIVELSPRAALPKAAE